MIDWLHCVSANCNLNIGTLTLDQSKSSNWRVAPRCPVIRICKDGNEALETRLRRANSGAAAIVLMPISTQTRVDLRLDSRTLEWRVKAVVQQAAVRRSDRRVRRKGLVLAVQALLGRAQSARSVFARRSRGHRGVGRSQNIEKPR